MAQAVWMNLGGYEQYGVNIKKTVGHAGANEFEDVLLIQTMFRYISEGLGPSALGLGSDYKMPDNPGEMDADTHTTIGEFQLRNWNRLLRDRQVPFGRLHPASYRHANGSYRMIRNTSKPLMAITYLHLIATDAQVMRGDGPYPDELIKMQPRLQHFFDMALIES